MFLIAKQAEFISLSCLLIAPHLGLNVILACVLGANEQEYIFSVEQCHPIESLHLNGQKLR